MTETHKSIDTKPHQEKSTAKPSKTITLKINSNMLMIVALVILLAVSVGQAVELGNLKDKISTGEVKAATANGSSGSSSTPANLKDLPTMVGGC